jgi:SAM-dependent methyltransferase
MLHPVRQFVMAPAVLEAIPEEARRFPSIEVGSGRAATSFRLVSYRRGMVCAYDLSPRVVRKVLDDSGGRIRGIVGDAFRLPLRAGSCGLAFSVSTLEHFPDPVPVLKEMARIARYVSIAVPSASALWTRLLDAMNLAGYDGTGEFYRLYEEELLRTHFAAAGLELIALKKIRFLGIFPFWVATAAPVARRST